MFAIPLPQKDKRLKGYMFSRWMLALSYIALAVYCIFKGRLELELFSPIFLFMANLQAVLLALSHINLIHPQRVTTKSVLLHFVPMAICLSAYGIVRLFASHVTLDSYATLTEKIGQAEVIIRVIWMGQYIATYIYFMCMFAREFRRWQNIAADFFADEQYISISLIQASWIVLLVIGLITFGITASLQPEISAVLNMIILALYIAMGILFLQYPRLFMEMKPVLYEGKEESGKAANNRWEKIRKQIIAQEMYLRRGITLEQVAREVGVSRTILSNTLNQQEGMNFNSFINRLRIQEAQRLMREKKGLSLLEIAEQVGYAEQSHFHHQFKHWSGKTPREWKISLGEDV
ncbi:MAG: helix-turn-helix transcriptional regulator [Paludibacteraceae bacterium]|nr:helix-turn-helix transcriptional regulator [Paludibacteraceae bacterium]